jgi:uncharacterized membrane protein YhiD involved in acid resistance
MADQLGLTLPAPLSVTTLVVNLLIGAVLGFVLAWHYKRFGKTYSNRSQLAQVFPLIVLTMVLIISVVKSSLALSLGLVGALSIVRFRTPIKEPEELSYLFLAIGIGLALGADQRAAALAGAIIIMVVIAARFRVIRRNNKHNLYLNIEVLKPDDQREVFGQINSELSQYVVTADMRRLDIRDGLLQVTYYIDCRDSGMLTELFDNLNRKLPGATLSFVEQKGLPQE